MDSAQFYLRLKHLIHSLDHAEDMADLDLVSQRLLEVVALKFIDQHPMTVSDVMGLNHLGSPATLHRKLDALRDSLLIETFNVGDDKRTKYLRPSPKALNHFTTLSNLVQLGLQRHGL